MSSQVVIIGGFVLTSVYAGYRLVKWVKGLLLRRSFTKFTNKYIQNPSEAMCKAMALNAEFMAEMEQYLKHREVYAHAEKTGATYDGLNVDEDDNIQLEILMIQPVSSFDIVAEKIKSKPGYYWLRYINKQEFNPVLDQVLSYWNILGTLTGTRYLNAEKTLDMFERELRNCVFESKQMKGKVKVKRNLAMLRLEVYPNSWFLFWGSRLYSVDIIPAYMIGEELYEPRPVEGDEMPDAMTWHLSFALKESQMLCEGAKMVLRVLKVLCKREADFGNFTSYQMMTVVLHEMNANKDWSEPLLSKRLSDVLSRLEKSLAARNLRHYFLPEINLLSAMPLYSTDYLHDRIKHLRINESEMRKLLQ